MMKNLHKLALISAISVGFFSQANPATAESRITCESRQGRYNFCNVDTRGGVRFVRQISNAQCREGSTWGYDRNGIWVDQGCSAEFAVRDRGGNNNNNYDPNYNSNSGGDNAGAIIGGVLAVGAIAAALASGSGNNSDGTITCGSERGNFTRCPVDIRRRDRVILRRQLSNSGCWEGSTWGYDRDGIWVDEGCRGQFEIRR